MARMQQASASSTTSDREPRRCGEACCSIVAEQQSPLLPARCYQRRGMLAESHGTKVSARGAGRGSDRIGWINQRGGGAFGGGVLGQ